MKSLINIPIPEFRFHDRSRYGTSENLVNLLPDMITREVNKYSERVAINKKNVINKGRTRVTNVWVKTFSDKTFARSQLLYCRSRIVFVLELVICNNAFICRGCSLIIINNTNRSYTPKRCITLIQIRHCSSLICIGSSMTSIFRRDLVVTRRPHQSRLKINVFFHEGNLTNFVLRLQLKPPDPVRNKSPYLK